MKKNICLTVSFLVSILLLVGCGCEHTYAAATCTEPSKCTKCGEIQGESLGHDYRAATCIEGSKCNRCGQIDGSALGHTTDFGICTRCNTFQGKDIAEQIITNINNGNSEMNSGNRNSEKLFNATTYDQMYSIMCTSTDDYESAVSYYNKAINLCGTYSELSSLKSALQTAVYSCPTEPYSSSKSALETWVYEEGAFRINVILMEDDAEALAGKIGKSVTLLDEYN